ncbi:helix-turn-helix domain-containing protein [Paenibacillus illinoisensis]|uniref:Transcriptional regulator n=1 Tax=Paenibacillus illinoisensis TaxID=59845 RepID=A0A2W0CLR0_9BACL|nr:helix-turn-helix domain-containing protein [Paenibacillus illinoisensis]PYY29195.1 Transcriptional regulator [Paenibacillus illinoisensis]
MELNMTLNGLELWKASGGFSNEPHVHDDWYQVTLPVRGECHLVQEQQAYPLQAGQGIIAHPQMEHFFEIGSDSAVIVIKFRNPPGGGLGDLDRRRAQTEFRPTKIFDPSEISRLFRGWSALLLDDAPESLQIQEIELAVEAYLSQVLSGGQQNRGSLTVATAGIDATGGAGSNLVCEQLQNWFERTTSNGGAFIDPHLRRVLEYIHSDYTSSMDIDSMAAIAHQSRYHFMRSFKALTGSTPYQYVLHLRVEEATRRLRLTTDSVTTISFRLGFSNVSQFYRVFQRIKGVTPMEYRNQM